MSTKREPGYYRVKVNQHGGFEDYWDIAYYVRRDYWIMVGISLRFQDNNFSEIIETPISVEPPTIREIRKVETDLPAFKAGWDACNTHKDDDKENVAQMAFDYTTWKKETKH
ncbi:MAG: hypothetical protein WC325_12300 [Candidatus Bathyarchaeia archaeon]